MTLYDIHLPWMNYRLRVPVDDNGIGIMDKQVEQQLVDKFCDYSRYRNEPFTQFIKYLRKEMSAEVEEVPESEAGRPFPRLSK